MFPYKDENPTEHPAVITVAIILANILAFLLVQGAGAQGPLARSVCDFGLIPGEVLHSVRPGSGVELAPGMICMVDAVPKYWTVLTSMFMHGGWFHLIGNMLFLWVFGNNIEAVLGHGKFLIFYLLSGTAAAAGPVRLVLPLPDILAFRVMLNRLTPHQEHDVFRDIRRQIRDTLEVPAHQE